MSEQRGRFKSLDEAVALLHSALHVIPSEPHKLILRDVRTFLSRLPASGVSHE